MRYELMIAVRYLFSRRRKRFVSFMCLVSVLGVSVGVACLITVLSVMSGFGYELQKRILGSNPNIIIEKENGIQASEYSQIYNTITGMRYIKGAYPFVWGQAVLRFRSRTQGVVIRSIDLDNRIDVSKLAKHIETGGLHIGDDGIIIGKELSITMGVFIGDELNVITPASSSAHKFKVKGIFNSGMYEYDLNLAYVNLNSAKALFAMGNRISGIGIDIDNIENAAYVKDQLAGILAASYYIRTWQELNRNLFSALKLEKWAMFVILTLIVIVAALNIVSTLTVMVTQKSKDIGILKAIGATRAIVMAIFSMQGLIIGFLGVLFGAIGGIGLSFLLKKYHFITLPRDIYYISEIPVKISISDSIVIVLSAMIISFIASIYPAYQASRLNPADALRYE